MRSRQGLPDFSHSMTDLMASVAVTFLLLAAIFMLRASAEKREAQSRLESARSIQDDSLKELNALMDDLRARAELRNAVQPDPTDKFVVTVEFPEDALYFAVNDDKLVAENAPRLVEPLKQVVERVCKINEALTNSIILEGHTDPQGKPGVDGYRYNVRLSALRAQAVYFAVREQLEHEIQACMDKRFTVAGRGPVQAKDVKWKQWNDPARPRDAAADRRVVLKVRFTSGGEALARAQ
jgi:flagellar motor protein MotB